MNTKIKLVSLVFITFICTGCTANYNINIFDDKISEELEINDSTLDKNIKDIYTTNALPVDKNEPSFLDYDTEVKPNQVKRERGIKYYDIVAEDDSLKTMANLSFSNYKNSRIVNSFFNNININNYDDMFSIYGYNGVVIFNLYPELNDVNIIVKSDMKMVENNADSVENNKYVWNFKRNVDSEKTMYISFNPKETKKINKKPILSLSQILIIICCSIIVSMLLIIYIKFDRKKYRQK